MYARLVKTFYSLRFGTRFLVSFEAFHCNQRGHEPPTDAKRVWSAGTAGVSPARVECHTVHSL